MKQPNNNDNNNPLLILFMGSRGSDLKTGKTYRMHITFHSNTGLTSRERKRERREGRKKGT